MTTTINIQIEGKVLQTVLVSATLLILGIMLMRYLMARDNGGSPLSPEEEAQVKAEIPGSYRQEDFLPYLSEASEPLFKNSHYAEAVFAAIKTFEQRVKSALHTKLFGKKQVDYVWGPDADMERAALTISSGKPEEQKMIYQLHIWLIEYVRNPNAHETVIKDKLSALAHLHQINMVALVFEQALEVSKAP